jgi:hypothetical protein
LNPGGRRTSTTHTSGRCSSTAARKASPSADRRHDLEAVLVEQPADALAQEREVLGDHDAHGTSAVQDGGAADGRRDGQRAVERGQALVQAVEPVAVGSAPPRPSSRTSMRRRPFSRHRRTLALCAWACLTALVSASATVK